MNDQIVAVDEVLGGRHLRTHYAYSVLDELTQLIEAQRNTTQVPGAADLDR